MAQFIGTNGNDVLEGTSVDDTLAGGSGNDTISGVNGGDVLDGESGNDRLYGLYDGAAYSFGGDNRDGNDVLNGGTGDDTLYGDLGDDTLNGGDGSDYLGEFSFGRTYSEPGNDSMNGGTGNDRLYGGDGDDILSGENGEDTVDGGDGDDTISGGGGGDTIIGGTGQDTFRFDVITDSAVGADRDYIEDFGHPGDRIDVSNIDAAMDLDGHQAFTFIGTAPLTGAGQISVFDDEGNTVIQLSTDNDPVAESEIEVEDGSILASSWTSSDFTGAAELDNRPVVSAVNQTLGTEEFRNVSSWLSAEDSDGDAINWWCVWDYNGAPTSGYFRGDGLAENGSPIVESAFPAEQRIRLTSEQLASLEFGGATENGTDQLAVTAWDGTGWGEWAFLDVLVA